MHHEPIVDWPLGRPDVGFALFPAPAAMAFALLGDVAKPGDVAALRQRCREIMDECRDEAGWFAPDATLRAYAAARLAIARADELDELSGAPLDRALVGPIWMDVAGARLTLASRYRAVGAPREAVGGLLARMLREQRGFAGYVAQIPARVRTVSIALAGPVPLMNVLLSVTQVAENDRHAVAAAVGSRQWPIGQEDAELLSLAANALAEDEALRVT